MARGYSKSRSETDFRERDANDERTQAAPPKGISAKQIDSISDPLIKALVRQSPIIPSKSPNNPGDKDVLPLDAIFEAVSEAIPSTDFLEKEYSNRAKAAYAAIATDMLELNLLQAERVGRVRAAAEYGPKDEEEVAARMDKQIAEIKSSLKDNIRDLDEQTSGELGIKSMVQDLAYQITQGVRNGLEKGNGKKYAPTETRERKKQLDTLFNFISQ